MEKEMSIRVITINLKYVFLGLRCLGYFAFWLVFGQFTLQNFIGAALIGLVIEVLYNGYKYLSRPNAKKLSEKKFDFYKLDNNKKVVPCSYEETEAFTQAVGEQIEELDKANNKQLDLLPPVWRHEHIAELCISAIFTGRSLKGEPVRPWEVVVRHSEIDEIVAHQSFASWDEAMVGFDDVKKRVEKSTGVKAKPPTLH